MNKINLLLIGAQKSGTTSLHNYLSMHKEIHMSSPLKEPLFFFPIEDVKKYFAQRGIKVESKQDLLRRLMMRGFKNQPYFGESSTTYTIGETSLKYDLPRKVFEYNPNMKILYIIRNPFSRFVSHYKHLAQKGNIQNWDFYLASEHLWGNSIYTSMYYYQLSQWIKYFDLSSVHVLFFEDFIKKTDQCIVKLWNFLEVSNEIIDCKAHNVSPDQSNLYFSDDCYNRIVVGIKEDCSKLSNLIGVDVFEKWNFDQELWVR